MDPVHIVQGTALPLDRSDVDTDQIIPAEWLKRVERTGFGQGLFSSWRDDRSFVLNDERFAGATILVAGPNFGTGSSREHAVWAIQQYGFQAVISPRFADIFRNNSLKNGLLPIIVPKDAHARLLAGPSQVKVDLAAQTLTLEDGTAIEFPIDAFSKMCLLEGLDELGFILKHEDAIAAYEAKRDITLDTRALA